MIGIFVLFAINVFFFVVVRIRCMFRLPCLSRMNSFSHLYKERTQRNVLINVILLKRLKFLFFA